MINENSTPNSAILPIGSDSKTHNGLNSLPIVALLVICLAVLVFKLDAYPRIWFDEGYKLNAAYTVAHDGLYATYTTDGYVPFDPGTSGGPADILPTALAIKLFGSTIVAARLANVLYTLLAAISLYQIGCYLWGKLPALFCVLLVVAIPPISQVGFITIGRQSLSEGTAFSLMVFGLWILSHAWRTRSLSLSLMSGLMMGLGMLSKTQIAIGLVPALLAVAGWRWLRDRKGLSYLFAPAIMVMAVFLGWMVIGQLLTPFEIRQHNSALLMDAIKTNILTTLHGSNLDSQALLVIAIMLLGMLTSAWRIWRAKTVGEEQWIELTLVLFVLFMTIWFAVFSIGWVRYAYAGLIVGSFLIGRFIWDLLAKISANKNEQMVGAVGIAVVAALSINFYVISNGAVANDAQNTAQYIATSIPKDAVIETWEWELDMLSGHRQFHHPQQALLFEAIRQSSHHQSFNLTYDALQANPDYLIVGQFGGWTGIYSDAMLQKYFTPVANYGVYHIYKRISVSRIALTVTG
ncbi:MAG: glycosyltransferase family 39 protein [Anaerolineae bacterium]|nr:glycosyltransferase family 39 protein [Anaerolineae bacterium]